MYNYTISREDTAFPLPGFNRETESRGLRKEFGKRSESIAEPIERGGRG